MMSSHMLPTITIPTNINSTKNTVINNIFTNQLHPDMKSGNLALAISDHLPSSFTIPKDNQNHPPKNHSIYTRKTKNFDRVNFVLGHLDIDWNSILQANMDNVNTSLQLFLTKINELLDKYMLLRKVSKRDYKRRFKPWITDTILDKINEKNKSFKKVCPVRTRL